MLRLMKGVFGRLSAPHQTQCELFNRSTATKMPPVLFFLRKRLEVGHRVVGVSTEAKSPAVALKYFLRLCLAPWPYALTF